MAKYDIGETLKTAVTAFFIGIIPAVILGAIATMLTGYSWFMYIIYALLLVWAVPKLPREVNTFFDILIVMFLLLAIGSLVGTFIPIPSLQWVNISSVETLLGTLVTAIVAIALKEEYIPL